MNILYKIVSFVYRTLAKATGKEPVEYLASIAGEDVDQDKFNLMIDRLELN